MKKVLLSALMICALATAPATMAQQREMRMHDRQGGCPTEQMCKELNLTETQKTEMQAANAKMREAIKQAREENDAAMQKILTPEQYKKMKEMRKPGKEMRKGHMKPHRGMKPCKGDSIRCIQMGQPKKFEKADK